MDGQNNLTLLKFPEQNIWKERIEAALIEMQCPDEELYCLDSVLCSLINFYNTLSDPRFETIAIQLEQIRAFTEYLYNESN